MNIVLESVDFSASEALKDYTSKKVLKLNQFYDKIIQAQVFFKLSNTNSKENKFVELILAVPGDDIVVKKQGQTFEECIDLVVDTAKKLIIKKKEMS